eukprot:2100119-Heterocapsa_arctica.AAC.1
MDGCRRLEGRCGLEDPSAQGAYHRAFLQERVGCGDGAEPRARRGFRVGPKDAIGLDDVLLAAAGAHAGGRPTREL